MTTCWFGAGAPLLWAASRASGIGSVQLDALSPGDLALALDQPEHRVVGLGFREPALGIGEVDQGGGAQALLLNPFDDRRDTGAAAPDEGVGQGALLPGPSPLPNRPRRRTTRDSLLLRAPQ